MPGKWGVDENEGVVVLTGGNFNEFIQKHKYVFVKFFSTWCGHCKAMAPSYSRLARRMHSQIDGVPIAEVDATIETELA